MTKKLSPNLVVITAVTILALGLTSAPTRADLFTLEGVNSSSSKVDVDFAYTPGGTPANGGTLTIKVANNSTHSGGSTISGFAFNVPSGFNITSIGGDNTSSGPTEINPANVTPSTTSPNNYWVEFDLDSIDTPANLGAFDLGVKNSESGNFINGGTGNVPKIEQGQFRIFTLAVVGTGLGSLTTTSFLSTLSSGGNPNTEHQYFAARLQDIGGTSGVTSDTAIPTGPPVITALPVPPSFLLMGIGGLGLVVSRLRRKKA